MLEYLGDFQTKSYHISSGREIFTDAPLDNGGQARSFAASDLICSALCSCMMTMMGMLAKKEGINLQGLQAELTKTMQSTPRRIAKIEIVFSGVLNITNDQKERLISEARKCPAQLSLSEEIEKSFVFDF